jgi:hypothetical protein
MIFKCLACLVKEKNRNKVLLASLITLTNSENFSESRIRFQDLRWLPEQLLESQVDIGKPKPAF